MRTERSSVLSRIPLALLALVMVLAVPSTAPAQIEECWAGGGAPNHCDSGADQRYDIWQANCHTAANVAVCSSPHNTGIIVCGGTPEGPGNPGDHTFNYKTDTDEHGNVTTTYWNWGKSCGPCAGAPPATFGGTDCHSTCVKDFCDKQWDGGTDERCLPPGDMVEIPGPSVCVTEVSQAHGGSFASSLFDECKACCNSRAGTWPNRPGYCQRGVDSEDFRAACTYLCEGFFLNGHPGGVRPPASCPFRPSVLACHANGTPTTRQEIEQACAALTYASPTGSPQSRRCFSDCVNNTLASQAANCAGAPGPPTAACSFVPNVEVCDATGRPLPLSQIEQSCSALVYADPNGSPEELACYEDCVGAATAGHLACAVGPVF